ncbi:DUF1254 domain-containing protein [Paludisphaera mucosa]|uniref:DUF1254 domain-containing protein n=1 Tax=Paludisphaera mucosa TaxID=3030827 RepID=A0ABT6FIM5_9BACT|nr:DUF1254 domain-containing protein [Paludisphaera mucosa]MDG3007397.1 DUF1254 domain-containing protein [Paludisphaera mucosa]
MSPLNRLAATLRTLYGDEDRRLARRSPRPRRANRPSPAAVPERLEDRTLMTAHASPSPARAATDPATIQKLAAAAYVWGLAPEFLQRFSTYNTTLGAPFNALEYVSQPAAWNDAATNAGDASVLYINGFTDFTKAPALVLTVPPSSSQYYVVNYLDDYLNTVGSIGTRTTPSDTATSYLLVGPNSPYAKFRTVDVHGYRYRVMASDTNVNWMLIRVATNTLADASAADSVPNVYNNVVKKFALNTLAQFEANGHQPVYPTSYDTPAPTTEELIRAEPFRNTPTQAVAFFNQLGSSVKTSPIPARNAGLSGSALSRLPAWVVPQYDARLRYLAPSYGQQAVLRAFAPLGLTANGYRIPRNWGKAQLQALQAGYEQGQQDLDSFISQGTTSAGTNYWTILNTIIGTYPNDKRGYEIRSAIVLNGGSANVPLDAVYPSMNKYLGTTQLDGNNTYSITFTPPAASAGTLPADGIYPPLVTDAQGDPRGFWAITLYQPDPSEVAAPYLSQAGVLNTSYSTADTAVVSVDPATDVMTVSAPSWGVIQASTPLLFGSNAAAYGLSPNTVYYIASTPTTNVDATTGATTYSFTVSPQWIQTLSSAGVPIQYSGGPGAIVDLQQGSAAGALSYGVVKPVAQLGSPQLVDGQLAKNADGSLTIWVGPTLPAGAAASNWIPTPSTAYFNTLYPGKTVSTALQIIMRMYYPTPGDSAPSILPYRSGTTKLPESYIPPSLVQIS